MTAVRKASHDVLYIDRSDPPLEAQLDAKFRRIPGLLQWKIPGGWKDDVLSFGAAVTSGRVDEATFESRKAICQTCPLAEKDKSGKLFCVGCRCGRWVLAELDGSFAAKLGWRNFKCPMGKF